MIGRNRVVITGIGVLAANGIGKDAFWNSLLAGESGIGSITRCNVDDLPSKIAGEVKNLDVNLYTPYPIKAKRLYSLRKSVLSECNFPINSAGV